MKLQRRFERLLKSILQPKTIHRLNLIRTYWNTEPGLKYLSRVVDPEKNAVDIGANRGIYTEYMSRLVPRVFAYEPNPILVDYLNEVTRSNVVVRPFALSDHEGTGILEIPKIGGEESFSLGRLVDVKERDLLTFPVKLRKLDNEFLENIGFIKIDVEGHERKVLEGAQTVIERFKPGLLVEIEQRHNPRPIGEIFDYFEYMGYTGFFLSKDGLHRIKDFSVEIHQNPHLNEVTDRIGKTKNYVNNFFFKYHR
jgi:FkbM family methyltransferase